MLFEMNKLFGSATVLILTRVNFCLFARQQKRKK